MLNLKVLLLLCTYLVVGFTSEPVKPKVCCDLTAIEDFAYLANDKDFVNKHENPEPFRYVPKTGEMISFEVAGGQKANAFMIKAKKDTKKYLLVFHEWWGLNDYVKQESEKYYAALKEKYHVLAIDLYDGKLATTREDAGKYMQAISVDRAKAIVEGALNMVGKDAEVATVGWCFGGGWSLQAALIAQQQAKACIIYYGMPEKDKEKLKNLNAKVLGIFASQEKWINTEVVKEFEQNLKTANKEATILQYDADHAFANPSNPKYNKVFADEAFEKSIKFIKKNF